MTKSFILDTNVLLHDSESIFKFQDNEVLIPLVVIEELDTFKSRQDEKGRNARQLARTLDSFIQTPLCSLSQGVKLPNGGTLKVVSANGDQSIMLPSELSENKTDNKILRLGLKLKAKQSRIVSKDINLRVKANALGLRAEDYENDKIVFDDLYTGYSEVIVDKDTFDVVDTVGRITVGENYTINNVIIMPNQYLSIKSCEESDSVLVRYTGTDLVPMINIPKIGIWGITNRNTEQLCALDALLNPEIEFVTLIGKAGTGKTLLAIAAGLEGVENIGYNKVLVSRPVFPMGKDLGYLPGDLKEKMNPWMQPIYDNTDFLLNGVQDRDGKKIKGHVELIEQGMIEIEALTYIRGRSIPMQYMIVDEAQNLTPHEVKTIITRAGMGTKIVLTGDPHQIDNPYVDASSNGLSYAADRFKAEKLGAHITLTQGERSPLAELASNIL